MSLRRQCWLYAPLTFSVLFCFLAAYFDGVMQVLAERRAQQVQSLPPLPDVGHSVLPYIRWWALNDLYIGLFALLTVLHFSPTRALRPKVLRRFLFLEGVVLLLRGFSVVLTTLSIPLRDCHSDALGNPLIESFYIFIYIRHTCADLLFSGHTATYTLFALFWSHYSRGDEWRACGIRCDRLWMGLPATDAVGDPSGWHWGKLVPWTLFLLGVFFILSTHFHYSIDVYVAFMLTALLFHLYHYYVKLTLEQKTVTSAFLRWFEQLDREQWPAVQRRGTGDEAEGEEGEEEEGEAGRMESGRPVVEGDGFAVLYGVSLLDGLKMRRPEEVGRLALASAIADMEHRQHVVVTGGAQGWY